MDPVTGLAALVGISLASVAGLRLKKKMEEGFEPLPDQSTDYANAVRESQSRYNMFSRLVNPISNSIIPVGSPDSTVKEQKETVSGALAAYTASFAPDSSETLVLKKFENQFQPRSDSNKSLYGAMKFCRDAGKQTNPFTVYNSDDSIRTQGAISPEGLKFDEICGVCLTSGVDEEGNRFRGPQGMVLEPSTRDAAIEEQKQKGWSYARVAPAIGTCEGAPGTPAFAINAKDLNNFRNRQACIGAKSIGGAENCALCYDSDNVYASVPPSTQTYPISFVVQGTGTLSVQLRGSELTQKVLSETSPTTIELTGAKEGDTFLLDIRDVANSQSTTNVFGYMASKTPREGLYTMPLNLLATIDDETGASPSKSGGFFTFSNIGLDVAKMRPGSGKTRMRLRGILPFTFVQPSEFPAMDCLDGPYQTQAASASAFSTDQPCFAKGSKPGNYNDTCLRQRVLDAGCTNAGTLYQNPSVLNSKDGTPQTLTQIYQTLQGIASQDMIDVDATKQCSGRSIETPCDPFILNAATTKFGTALQSGNEKRATQAKQCLSFLYHNKGANEKSNPARVGPTYSGLVTYKNDQREIKNIYCLPEGALNPDTNESALTTLTRIGDNGYKGKISVEAIKQFLSDQLALATDGTRNANTDPDRKAAIVNCFGPNLSSLPPLLSGNPTVVTNPCGVIAQYVRVLPSQSISDSFIEISQLAVINKDGQNVAPGKSTDGTSPSYPSHGVGSHNASNAIDGQIYPKGQNFYHSAQAGGNSQFLLNLGQPTDITKIIFISRGDGGRTTNARKNGIRLQLLDANQSVVNEKRLNSAVREDITYLQTGAEPNCKSDLPTPAAITFPAGYTAGLYVRFYDITDANPDIVPGNRGWGGRLGTPNAYAQIRFNDGNLGRYDRSGVVARGYYVAPGPETLYLYTESDDGIYVSFNNVQRISNWTIHAPTGDSSPAIQIPAAGVYPFELRFYEWGGGAVCNLYYRINDEATWRTDLSARFAYKPAEVAQEESAYQATLSSRQVSSLPTSFRPSRGNRVGAVQNNGDYLLTMTITPRGIVGDWASIVHFTKGGNCCTPGDRMPAIWFWPNELRLHVRVGDSTDGNWGIDPTTRLSIGTSTTFRLECRGSTVKVQIGSETINTRQPSQRPTGTANVFMGDSYYAPANCDITNFSFTPLN